MSEQQFRTVVTAIVAVILGLRILLVLMFAWSGGTLLREHRWGWSGFNLLVAGGWLYLVVSGMREINRYGLLGRSPWGRDRDDE